MVPCKACGGVTISETELGSSVCTDCGTLVNAEQVILAADLEPAEFGTGQRVHATGSALKSIRTPGWTLAGQGTSDIRDGRNKAEMHEFIGSLTRNLGSTSTSLADRACQLFDVAMTRGALRWGRKARLTAAAALALAFREAQRSDPLRDIAILCTESVTNIARAVTATAALVGHASGSSDSSLHLPSLIAHLSAIVSSVATDANDAATNAAKLPIPLKKMLVTLHPHFRAVEHIAESLCALFGRLAAFEGATTPATSCAICILALEAEARKTLPALSELSSALGVRFGVSGSTVQARYRTACEVASEWTAELPWAARYTRDVPRRGKMQRAKEGRRAVVAQYLKDAVELQEATWLKKVAGVGQPVQEAEVEQPAARLQSGKRELVQDSIQVSHARKRRKPTPHDADVASTFLLSQGAGPATCHRVTKTALFISDAAMQLSRLNSLPAHMLTTDTSLLSLKHPPTRLQLLISSRGSSDMVLDDELFDAGELDGLLRTDEERERYMHTVDWLDYVPAYAMPGSTLSSGGRTRKESSAKGIERINMDRLAQLFGEDLSDEKGEDFGAWGMDDLVTLDDEKDEDTSAAEMGGGHRYPAADVEDEVVDEWRPASPGGDGGDWIDF